MGEIDFKYLHTMMRVYDLDKSIDFYTKYLNMKVLRKSDYPSGKFTLVFLGYGSEDANTVLELTYNWDQEKPYNIGDAWGHIAIGVKGIYNLCKKLEDDGVNVVRKPGPMKHGTTVIAFIKDPDGYSIELIEK
ncbi:MAG: lactoylglutathione lyase [Rickettsiales bacterium]|nr:lactoylglutathione lyase [Pelagibacterales bacterium]MBT35888.1 lactoylglutathione lyase [Rickettsiales bacterium]|tara:strand:+ start:1149 stop:1547 length:399 start_codon:yes stop_codon:yes gene_type:complete